jgi:hypothetical protein
MPELKLNVEWDDRSKKATGFTTVEQADRFIDRVCKRAAPDIHCEIITLIPL